MELGSEEQRSRGRIWSNREEEGGGSFKKKRLEIESGSLTEWFWEKCSKPGQSKGSGKGSADGQVLSINWRVRKQIWEMITQRGKWVQQRFLVNKKRKHTSLSNPFFIFLLIFLFYGGSKVFHTCQALTRRQGAEVSQGFFELLMLANSCSFECATYLTKEWQERQKPLGKISSEGQIGTWCPPSSMSSCTAHRKCGCYKRLKQKSSLSQITSLNYICTPKDNLPYSWGSLPLYPVCSKDWARAMDEMETAVKHLSSESLQPSAHVIPITPYKSSKVLLIFGIIETWAWGHWTHRLTASLE